MSIYTTHLSSIPFKSELYLLRYIKFIEACLEANKSLPPDVYTEEHHILPKAKTMFPQFESLRKHPWNAARLTLRQHFVAHLMLKKAYMNVAMCRAVTKTAGKNSRWYEQAKIDLSAAMRERTHSDETKMKMSIAKKGKPKSEEHRKKLSVSATGKTMSDEAKMKLSIAGTGRTHGDETRMKMSIAATGRTMSDEAKMKMAEAAKNRKGQKHPHFKGFYQTPFGTFDSATAAAKATSGGLSANTIITWCKKDNLKVISNVGYSKSSFLRKNYPKEDVVGKKTFNDLGFSFIPKILMK